MTKFKQTINLLFIAVIATVLTTSCGGGQKSTEENGDGIVKIKPEKAQVTGDLSDYLQVVDNEYEIIPSSFNYSFKFKATKSLTEQELKNKELGLTISLLNDNGMPIAGTSEIFLSSSSYDKLETLLKNGSGEEIIQFTTHNFSNFDKSKKFVVSSTMKDNSSSSGGSSTIEKSNVDCDKFIKDYEAFVNSYVKLLKKYKANPTDMTILNEYTEAAQKAAEMEGNAATCDDPKHAAKFLELANKIAQAAL